ncbi:MAG: ABC transporter substrate-binding protein [Dehalococcoidia bacterium]|nr:ABC transporter substrate-binding protein [Dehalococcoidia bacterium]
MLEGNYWTRRTVGRRAVLRGAGLGIAGMAGAALLGCGPGAKEVTSIKTAPTGNTAGAAATPGGGKAPAGQARLKPGIYDSFPQPSLGERDPAANARYGGTLLTRYLDPPHMDFNKTLSCTVNTTYDYTMNKLVRAKMGQFANQMRLEIEPDLASKWESSPDATRFTFHLRPGVKFHNVNPTNGRVMTSEDVKMSFERYKNSGVMKDVFLEVANFETPDPNTLVVNLTQPLVDFPTNIASWSFIWPRELIQNEAYLNEHAVGTGPFIQQEWIRKEKSTFVKNPDYFENGLPYLDKVVPFVMNDNAVVRSAYLTDNLGDWGAATAEDAEQMMKQSSDSVQMLYEGLQGANSQVVVFQMNNPIVQDVRVRRAVNMSIDRPEYVAAQGYVSDGFSKPSISWQELFDTRPTLASEGPYYQYNPAEASKLLQAAGYSAAKPLTFEVTSWYLSSAAPQRYGFEDIILQQFKKVKELNITHRTVDNPTSVVMLNERKYETAHGMTFGPPAYSVDQSIYPFYHSKGGLNFGNRNDPTLDAMLEAQRRETKREAQKEIWKKVWDYQLNQVYDMFLPSSLQARGFWHNYVMGYRPFPSGLSCYGNSQVRGMWLDEGAPKVSEADVTKSLGLA